MRSILKPNERLVYAGVTAIRAPDGNPLKGVPQYQIKPAHETDPISVVSLQMGERLIVAGTEHTEREAAQMRFAASMEGNTQSCADGKPLYIKEAIEKGGKETGLSLGEEKTCDLLIDDLVAIYTLQRRAMEGKG